jgi:hypothetical protein
MLCISAGMNFLPYDESTVKRITFRFGQTDYVNHLKEKCFPFWDHLLKTRKQITDSAPTVYKFLKEKYYE